MIPTSMIPTSSIIPTILIGSVLCLIIYIIPMNILYYTLLIHEILTHEHVRIENCYFYEIILISLCGHVTRYFVKDIVIFNIFIVIAITFQLLYVDMIMIEKHFFGAIIMEYMVNIINISTHIIEERRKEEIRQMLYKN